MNKYNLQVYTSYFKEGNQPQGNGLSPFYLEGRFENGKVFKIDAFRGVFYLYVGNSGSLEGSDYILVDQEPVDVYEHTFWQWQSEVIFKYVELLLDRYALANETKVVVVPAIDDNNC